MDSPMAHFSAHSFKTWRELWLILAAYSIFTSVNISITMAIFCAVRLNVYTGSHALHLCCAWILCSAPHDGMH